MILKFYSFDGLQAFQESLERKRLLLSGGRRWQQQMSRPVISPAEVDNLFKTLPDESDRGIPEIYHLL